MELGYREALESKMTKVGVNLMAISMKKLALPFSLLIFGNILAILTFLVEIIYKSRMKKKHF